jgi:hypothetical protein
MKSYSEYMGAQREDGWQKRLLLYLQTPPDVVFCSADMPGAVASRVQDLLRTIQVCCFLNCGYSFRDTLTHLFVVAAVAS